MKSVKSHTLFANPNRYIDKREFDPTDLKAILEKNFNQPFIGIYNDVSEQVYPFPAIKRRVWLLKNEEGVFEKGWEHVRQGDKFGKGHEISEEELAEYNQNTNLIPRACSLKGKDDGATYSTSHEYCIEKINAQENIDDFYGFSLTTGESTLLEPKFIWISGSLNDRDAEGKIKRDANGVVIRKPGMLLPEAIRPQIEEQIFNAIGKKANFCLGS